ncbi:MAG TPA: ATP synthase subunit I [Desulfitobacteriaceae bacterium]|nr:ATP synthase subunit I [Desulfitobacteriaceae bacterium]
MNDPFSFVLAVMIGLLAGVIFYGGLWRTVQTGLSAKRPEFLFLGSFLLRTGIVLAAFYFVSQGKLSRLLSCLAGFMIARFLVNQLIRKHKSVPVSQEGGKS